jgi:NADPH:quinone reductase-like Zn-dependent oxidoreductase
LKAAVYRRYGAPDVIRIEDVPTPDPGPNELLVRVRAASVSAGDARLRSARVPPGFGLLMRLAFGITGPRKPILGWDFAGEVAAVGSSVSGFAPGERAFGARMGSHAEYVIRGRGWTEGAQPASFRNYADPEMRTLIIGFRCAKAP